jgi:hypothetical protein
MSVSRIREPFEQAGLFKAPGMPTDHGSIDVQLRGELGGVARSESGNATDDRVGDLVDAWIDEARVSSPSMRARVLRFRKSPKDLRDVCPERFVHSRPFSVHHARCFHCELACMEHAYE